KPVLDLGATIRPTRGARQHPPAHGTRSPRERPRVRLSVPRFRLLLRGARRDSGAAARGQRPDRRSADAASANRADRNRDRRYFDRHPRGRARHHAGRDLQDAARCAKEADRAAHARLTASTFAPGTVTSPFSPGEVRTGLRRTQEEHECPAEMTDPALHLAALAALTLGVGAVMAR